MAVSIAIIIIVIDYPTATRVNIIIIDAKRNVHSECAIIIALEVSYYR